MLMLLSTGQMSNIPAIVLFPTPPFADETAITFFTSFMLRLCGSPRCMRGIWGGAPERGSPLREVSNSASYCHQHIRTRGFSCCKQRKVENNRGFNISACRHGCGLRRR